MSDNSGDTGICRIRTCKCNLEESCLAFNSAKHKKPRYYKSIYPSSSVGVFRSLAGYRLLVSWMHS